MFKTAFIQSQETNKTLLSHGDEEEAPAPPAVESDQSVAPVDAAVTDTGVPVTKGKEVEAVKEAEAEGESAPPAYEDDGKAPPPEKVVEIQGEEVKVATTEVSSLFLSCRLTFTCRKGSTDSPLF